MHDLKRLRVLKLDEEHLKHIEDEVVVEEPLEIRVNGESITVTMRTPGNDFDLAIGLLWTEGIIRSGDEIGTIAYCPNEDQPELKNVVNVGLVDVNRKVQSSRTSWSTSSCGLCGKATLDAIHQVCRPVTSTITVDYDVLCSLPSGLRQAQANFERTGGIHAVALFDAQGSLLVLREDIGRHNAVDKVLGAALVGNLALSETVMMVKEHIAETYGPIRYTIGTGCSGGSIMQHVIAGTYPGLLNGLQPNCSYQDQVAIELEIKDCGLLASKYFATSDGAALSATQQAAIEGKANPGFCTVWVNSFVPAYNPGILNPATGSSNCGGGFPAALVYDPGLRPNGVRCTLLDNIAPQLGTFVDTDGHTKANRLFDNVGVQYGLSALRTGVITLEDFVRLNEGIGSYSADLVWSGPAAPGSPAKRITSTVDGLETAYGAGLVVDGKQLAKVAIIDLRGDQNPAGDIHSNWRSWGQRERLDHANGHHGNQVIWASRPGLTPGAALARKAFLTMDAWLSSVEADGGGRSLEEKIVAGKPGAAHDFCLNTTGATDAEVLAELPLDAAACLVKFQGSPRQVAGGPLSENVLKCNLKPLDFFSADYNGGLFDGSQKARLQAVFPAGVCDWTKPGVEQVRADPWTTFADGPGGRPLGEPPVSTNGCAGKSEGKGNAADGECPGNSGGR